MNKVKIPIVGKVSPWTLAAAAAVPVAVIAVPALARAASGTSSSTSSGGLEVPPLSYFEAQAAGTALSPEQLRDRWIARNQLGGPVRSSGYDPGPGEDKRDTIATETGDVDGFEAEYGFQFDPEEALKDPLYWTRSPERVRAAIEGSLNWTKRAGQAIGKFFGFGGAGAGE